MPLSLRDAAFALNAPTAAPWSLKNAIANWPPVMPREPGVSVHRLASRFGPAGAALRSLSTGTANVWTHIDRNVVVQELRNRLRDPMIINQNPTGLCGPIAIVVELARRDPRDYVLVAKELLETGRLRCTGGRVIEAEEELRREPVISGLIGQVDWLLAATMRDDENWIEDVDDDANGWESLTTWDEQAGWIRDVLRLSFARYGFALGGNEIEFMRAAQFAVNAGGVAFFLIDANLLKDGGSDTEEDIRWRVSTHGVGRPPSAFGALTHSKDDELPPDHWVIYLGGLNLGANPRDTDRITFRLWSWGREYEISGTVDAFAEYLYGIAFAPVASSNLHSIVFGTP